jgi:pimeloyl-ACP methyl ester carboxylesterase
MTSLPSIWNPSSVPSMDMRRSWWSHAVQANCIHHTGQQRVALVGHSMGGLAIQGLAACPMATQRVAMRCITLGHTLTLAPQVATGHAQDPQRKVQMTWRSAWLAQNWHPLKPKSLSGPSTLSDRTDPAGQHRLHPQERRSSKACACHGHLRGHWPCANVPRSHWSFAWLLERLAAAGCQPVSTAVA